MYSRLFTFAKKFIPKISPTERTALLAGSVSIERDIISGIPNLKSYLQKYSYQKLNIPEDFNKKLNNFCSHIDDNKIISEKIIPQNVFDMIKDYKLYGLNIQKKYGGLEMNPHLRCKIVERITTSSGSIGSMVMVPNSLGPAELLHKYGTTNQKNKYLAKLAISEYIPCFGLTGLYNGSDAVNMKCSGNVVKIDDKLYLNITFSKRYITLAPIANLIGLAVKISDPKNYLDMNLPNDSITVLLLEKNKYTNNKCCENSCNDCNFNNNINIGYRHDPLGAQFPNGTVQGENIVVPIDDVIGGKEMIGKGWMMLMECLAEGRGISLPASAYASSSSVVKYVSEYCNVRTQFKTPIGQMEGIREKTAEIFSNTYIMYSMQNIFNSILSQNISSSVLSAIMKREMTEYARININNSMDVVGGWGIIKNKNNILANAYQLTPIPITVEGSNILTRSLIIYGQGLIKSHKYIYNIIQSIEENNIDKFKDNINDLVKDTLKIYGKIMLNKFTLTNNNLLIKSDNLSRQYALLSYLCLINYGPKLKTKEYISGRMADIMSDLYKCYSIIWLNNKLYENKLYENKLYENKLYDNKSDTKFQEDLESLEKYCINNLHNKIIDNMNLVLNDIKSPLKYLFIGVFNNIKVLNDDKTITRISDLFLLNNKIKDILTENVYVPEDKNDIRYKLLNWKSNDKLKEEIIKVN
jgi:acyl-CoA dehydrogenase